ncbi:hypothetical protein ACEWY4_016549 [Coilia grayii]|uniref:C-type lectin domain-containing protein n=1 Tax=Coilia grayii TaxID=363190 RepID=A0ABD1JLW3_9TELE
MNEEMDDNTYKTSSRGPQMTVRKRRSGARQMSGCSRFAPVGLGVMGVLLLMITTGLCVYYTFKLSQERDQLLSHCNALTQERQTLLNNYNDSTQDRETLLNNYIASIQEKEIFQSSNYALTKERDQLLRNYNIVTQERDQLRNKLPCPDGWKLYGKCYHITSPEQNWAEARRACQYLGADLVTIKNKEEQVFISQMRRWGWIGLQRYGSSWMWVDGTPLSTGYWIPGQLTNNNERCAMTGSLGESPILSWQDYPCSQQFSPICEKQVH